MYQALTAAQRAVSSYFDFLRHVYEPTDTLELVARSYLRTAVLLLTAITLGATAGVVLGVISGMRPGSRVAAVASSLSFVGLLTPSFLLALMGLFVFVRYISPAVGVRFVTLNPSADVLELRRLLPPALVLSVRPMAFMAQVTIGALQDVVHSDYVRTAYAKGLRRRTVLLRHIMPNIAQPVLTGISSSFMFSLSSLLVVELLFSWYGVGYRLVDAVGDKDPWLASYLLASIGITIVLVNTAVRAAIRHFDPRVLEPELAVTKPDGPVQPLRKVTGIDANGS